MEAKESHEAQVRVDPIIRRISEGDEHPAIEVTFPDQSATFNWSEMQDFIRALKQVMVQAETIYTEGEYDFGKED